MDFNIFTCTMHYASQVYKIGRCVALFKCLYTKTRLSHALLPNKEQLQKMLSIKLDTKSTDKVQTVFSK